MFRQVPGHYPQIGFRSYKMENSCNYIQCAHEVKVPGISHSLKIALNDEKATNQEISKNR